MNKSKGILIFLCQFLINGFYAPFWFDRDKNEGGIMLYIREDIPAKVLSHNFPSAESVFAEIILHKKKWFINCSYNPNKSNIKNHIETISRTLDAFSTQYGNILLLGDVNACVDDETMKDFCSSYCLRILIKQPTCFKNPEKPSCIDLILTNKPRSFRSTPVIETGLSAFHRMTVSVLKTHFPKLPLKSISYRDFKKFENERFMDSLYLGLNSRNIDYTKNPILFFN